MTLTRAALIVVVVVGIVGAPASCDATFGSQKSSLLSSTIPSSRVLRPSGWTTATVTTNIIRGGSTGKDLRYATSHDLIFYSILLLGLHFC